ncbi:MAG: GNAT family N-acetyltransferase [Gemmatimonadota bacterium]|nr:MAG: GNAT family N-acetyltransferase [Gemmatimonadota bacterium]
MIKVRLARDTDASAIAEIFRATYGAAYPYPQFYDPYELKRLIFADDTIVIVAEDLGAGRVVGTASVLEEKGAYTDLGGEFGRLAVHPEARHRGIGRRLMEARLKLVKDRLHIGIVEARIVQPASAKIAAAHGFTAVGYLPGKLLLDQRENLVLLVRHFGDALQLRRNHPRVIPEAYRLASASLEGCGLPCDAIVDEGSASYPYRDDFALEELTTEGYAALLRIQRGRLKRREVFGPIRLHYGYFKLTATDSHYLLARDRGDIVGAIGYTHDEREGIVIVFELIALQDQVIRYLITELLRKCEEELGAVYVEVDVSAYAPRMQRTFLEFGFLPVGYVPSLVFHRVERLDVLKMGRFYLPLDTRHEILIPAVRSVCELVISSFRRREVEPRVRAAVDRIALFEGLNNEQRERVAGSCVTRRYGPDELVFQQGTDASELHLVIAGEVEVCFGDPPLPIACVRAGECLGEVSVLSESAHSADAIARGEVETAVITLGALRSLIRQRPDVGVVLYRNLALGLGEKLQRSDVELAKKRDLARETAWSVP